MRGCGAGAAGGGSGPDRSLRSSRALSIRGSAPAPRSVTPGRISGHGQDGDRPGGVVRRDQVPQFPGAAGDQRDLAIAAPRPPDAEVLGDLVGAAPMSAEVLEVTGRAPAEVFEGLSQSGAHGPHFAVPRSWSIAYRAPRSTGP